MIGLFVKEEYKKIETEIDKRMKEKKERFDDYNKDIGDIKIKAYKIQRNNKGSNSKYLGFLIPYCDIKVPRQIRSHRPLVGPTLIKIRQILDDEIRRSLDPVINKQIEFNKKFLEFMENEISYTKLRIKELGDQMGDLQRSKKNILTKLEENVEQANFNIKEIFKLKRKLKDGN